MFCRHMVPVGAGTMHKLQCGHMVIGIWSDVDQSVPAVWRRNLVLGVSPIM